MKVTFTPVSDFGTTSRTFSGRDGKALTFISGRAVALLDGEVCLVEVQTATPAKFTANKPITAELRSFDYSRDAGMNKLRVRI